MKAPGFYTFMCCLFSLLSLAQSNDMLRGKVLFLSSDKTPAVGVEVSGVFNGKYDANTVFSTADGSFGLDFIEARAGNRVQLIVGKTDRNGQHLEVVNNREISAFRIPSIATDEFEIIVAVKGQRDIVAARYYKIIKTSADRELKKIKRQWENLLVQQEKNYQRISELGNTIAKLEQQNDSISIYREAFRLASINKDNASERVLKYLKLLDEGKSVQEAREVLSIEGAADDLKEGISQFRAAIEELETRAEASKSLFDYEDVIYCYNAIISYLEKMEADRLEMAGYYTKAANAFLENTDYETALDYQQRAIAILEKTPGAKTVDLIYAYNNLGAVYRALQQYKAALEHHRKAIVVYKKDKSTEQIHLAGSYDHIGITYQVMKRYAKALKYYRRSTAIRKKVLGDKHPSLATAYENIALTYRTRGQYKKALQYHQNAISIREAVSAPGHYGPGIGYMEMGITYIGAEDFGEAIRFLEKSLSIFKASLAENHSYSKKALQSIGLAYAKNKQFKDAREAFSEYEKLFPDNGVTYRNWAVYYALQNDKDNALHNLKKAVDLGYNDLKWLKTDNSIDGLRGEKAFIEMLQKLENNR